MPPRFYLERICDMVDNNPSKRKMFDTSTPDSDSSETNLVIFPRRNCCIMFCKVYWRILVILLAPLLFLPVAFIGNNNAYKCFFAFLVTATYWVTDAMSPCLAALLPIGLSSLMGRSGFINEIYVRNELLDCVGVMLIIIAVEQSRLHRRLALKTLLCLGCSHHRLSFVFFFLTMFLSMWISGIIACGLMMPFIKTILSELEKMGMLEVYQSIGKTKRRATSNEDRRPRPTEVTIFYFLGVAYSSSIGAATTITGSQTNQILKVYCETLFPSSPKIEFPQFMLLSLPGVLITETVLYFWLNFYFMGICRAHTDISLDIGMTEEEGQYIKTLLLAQYRKMGKIRFHEIIIGLFTLFTALMQATMSSAYIDQKIHAWFHNHFIVSSPCMLCAILLFIIPKNLRSLKLLIEKSARYFNTLPQITVDERKDPFLSGKIKACLTWPQVRQHFNFSVLFTIGGSAALFDSLRDSQMTNELENYLSLFAGWPSAALILFIVLFFKCLTEFAPGSCIVYSMLPHVARLGVRYGINPHYLMIAATIASSQSFHLVTGSPVNAMVSAYVHIPRYKMMGAGVGMSLASVGACWFTASPWAATVWSDPPERPVWSTNNLLHL